MAAVFHLLCKCAIPTAEQRSINYPIPSEEIDGFSPSISRENSRLLNPMPWKRMDKLISSDKSASKVKHSGKKNSPWNFEFIFLFIFGHKFYVKAAQLLSENNKTDDFSFHSKTYHQLIDQLP